MEYTDKKGKGRKRDAEKEKITKVTRERVQEEVGKRNQKMR